MASAHWTRTLVNSNGRRSLLESYGRWYGTEHFAIAFTTTIEGEEAKRVVTRGWDKTQPLPDGDYGASYLAGRGVERNPAVVLRPSNLLVVECDTEQDLALIQDLDLPETVTVCSSAPYKRHFYFRPAPDLERLPIVAFRFESGKLTADSGRYFLCPPAVHPSGSLYAFLPARGPEDLPIAVLPHDTYIALLERAEQEDRGLRDKIEFDSDAKVPPGNRRDFIFRYGCFLRRWGLGREEISEACWQMNLSRCNPPVERSLVELQIDGVMKQREANQEILRASILAPGRDEQNEIWEETPTELDENEGHTWEPLDLSLLGLTEPPVPEIGGLAYPGKKHLFSGEPETLKTWAVMILVAEQIRLGRNCVYIDFEMGAEETRRRFNDLHLTNEDLHNHLSYIEPQESIRTRVEDVKLMLQTLQPSLIVIDATTGALVLHGYDPNSGRDVEAFHQTLIRPLRATGAAIILLDHVVKDKEARGNFATGSERKVGAVNVHLGFTMLKPFGRGRSGSAKITTLKDHPGGLPRPQTGILNLESNAISHEISYQIDLKPQQQPSGPQPGFEPTILMEKISRYVEAEPHQLSRANIETAIRSKAEYTRLALDRLIEHGHLEETSGPRNARLVHLLRPYRQPLPGVTNSEADVV